MISVESSFRDARRRTHRAARRDATENAREISVACAIAPSAMEDDARAVDGIGAAAPAIEEEDGLGASRRGDTGATSSRASQDTLTHVRDVLDIIRGALAAKVSASAMEAERTRLVAATRALATRATSTGGLSPQCIAMACEIMRHAGHRTNEVVDFRVRYYAALYLYRACGVKANREHRERESLASIADVAKRALVAESSSSGVSSSSQEDEALRREAVALMLGVLARLTSDGEAAETMLASPRCADVGAALARWIALRLIDRARARELTIADLTRLAAVLAKSSSAEAKKFCDYGGVSALCASVQIDADACDQVAFLTPAAVVDCAKAIAGFCSGCPAHVDLVSVKEEIRAILSASTGKMKDPVPAVAASLLRQALASLEKYESSGDATSASSTLKHASLSSSQQHGSLGDCMAALDDALTESATRQSQAFGSRIELQRATSASSLYEDMANSPSKPVAAVVAKPPLAAPSSATAFSSPPTRSRGAGAGLSLGSPARARLPSGSSKRTTRTIIRRFAQLVFFVCGMFVVRAVFLGARV